MIFPNLFQDWLFYYSPDSNFPPLKRRGTLFTLLVYIANHFMWRSSKIILHYNNFSESCWGLISDGTWMFRANKATGKGHTGSVVPPLQSTCGSSGGLVRRGWTKKSSCQTRIAHTRMSLVYKHLGIWILVFRSIGSAKWHPTDLLPVWKSQTFLFQCALLAWKNWRANIPHVASIISTLNPGVQEKERTL